MYLDPAMLVKMTPGLFEVKDVKNPRAFAKLSPSSKMPYSCVTSSVCVLFCVV